MSSYRKVILKTYRASGAGSSKSVRAHPIEGQGLDTTMNVECSSSMRKNNPIGSLILIEAKITDKEGGTPFLYAHYNSPYRVISEQEADEILSKL
ncbi:MAG: hypothetical protein GY829_01430 [Gammaproteobacteria bacterium]|nr:hypothetical protein [Gammaproteobacteria bacterium]